jgi:hypothetical protein
MPNCTSRDPCPGKERIVSCDLQAQGGTVADASVDCQISGLPVSRMNGPNKKARQREVAAATATVADTGTDQRSLIFAVGAAGWMALTEENADEAGK